MTDRAPTWPDRPFPYRPTILVQLRRGQIEAVFEDIVHGILEQARHCGWQLLNLEFTHGFIPDDPPPLGAILRALPTDPVVGQLRERGIPIVRIGNYPHHLDPELPAVLYDYPAAGRMAAEHFSERHFQNLGFVGRDPWSDAKPIYEAFHNRAQELGCECHLLQIKQAAGSDARKRYASRRAEVGRWLSSLPKPVGIFSSEDWTAGRLGTWCIAGGHTIPEEVALLGCGNTRIACESAPVPLSSVDINREAFGRQAVILLQQLIQGKEPPAEALYVPPKGIVERRSSDILAIGNPTVARAMRYIWDHFADPVSIDTVAAQVAVSRRVLERAFRKHLGRTVNDERLRKRLDRCAELLLSTDMTVREAAAAAGFPTRSNFYRCFRQKFGVSPAQFRRERKP